MDWKKLKDVSQFTISKVWGYNWQKWDEENSKMLREKTYFEGARKIYDIECGDFKMSVSSNQIGSMLADCMQDGKSDLNGKTFEVKTNGKEGMEIRYYINLVREKQEPKGEFLKGDMAKEFNASQSKEEHGDLPF